MKPCEFCMAHFLRGHLFFHCRILKLPQAKVKYTASNSSIPSQIALIRVLKHRDLMLPVCPQVDYSSELVMQRVPEPIRLDFLNIIIDLLRVAISFYLDYQVVRFIGPPFMVNNIWTPVVVTFLYNIEITIKGGETFMDLCGQVVHEVPFCLSGFGGKLKAS
jgi:hypothetical protein